MNICAITTSRIPSPNANSIQALKAVQALLQEGHNVTLFGFDPLPEFAGQDLCRFYGLQQPVEVRTFRSSRRLFPYVAFLQALRLKPDLIYTWVPQVAALALLTGQAVIFEIHLQPSGSFGPFWHRLFARLPGRKRLVSITQALYRLLQTRYGIHLPPDQVVIAPNGVDLERYADLPSPQEARRQLGLPETFTVLCSGHLYAGRGVELFLELAKHFPETHFLWVGGRPQEVKYWQEQQARRQLENVTFYGFVPNHTLPLFQAAADVLLMPYEERVGVSSGQIDSAAIASPMKMFEYLASGRPILTSDLPVLREVLDETTAIFCPPADVEAWKEALQRLLANPALRVALGREARCRAQAYTWRERAHRILQGCETWLEDR
ncbi:MAG: glycosyltransferase family 4 protein [Anaerolineales bacterium]